MPLLTRVSIKSALVYFILALLLGILLALAGVWLAMTSGSNLTPADLLHEPGAAVPYGLALVAAICWGLYTNLSRRWAAGNDGGGVPQAVVIQNLYQLRFF